MDLATFFSLVLLTVWLVKWILKRRRILSTFERLGIPGPKPSFFSGNLSGLKKPYFEVDLVEKYGPIYGFFFGVKPVLAVSDPELLKIILVKEAQNFHARNTILPNAAVPSDLFRHSVVVREGPRWKENRDSITPAYTTSKFKMMCPVINSELDEAMVKISESAGKRQPFDLGEIFSTVFAKATLQVTFGLKMGGSETKAVRNMLNSLQRGLNTGPVEPDVYFSMCLPELEGVLNSFRIMRESVRKFFSLSSIEDVSEMCEVAIKARIADKKSDYTDVLQLMINTVTKNKASATKLTDYSEKLRMQEEDLVSNSLYLAVASYDLIRTISTYAVYELAKAPRVQEKLRKEIADINGDKKYISYENMLKMQYLDQVFNEAIRLHPTVPVFTMRVAEKDYSYKGQLIPKGMTVYAPQIGMQRSKLHFSDPESFIPERFEDKSKIDPYIYQPFGIGPRHCLGMRLTQYFAKVAMARIVQSFNLSVDPKAREVRPEFGFVVYRPMDPVQLIASPL